MYLCYNNRISYCDKHAPVPKVTQWTSILSTSTLVIMLKSHSVGKQNKLHFKLMNVRHCMAIIFAFHFLYKINVLLNGLKEIKS